MLVEVTCEHDELIDLSEIYCLAEIVSEHIKLGNLILTDTWALCISSYYITVYWVWP